mmetsp:Transcript_72897/g.202249  ORF Transcript_72897/g.202249 Transcript_72897/m.202249 type:complete len:201 (+) Transcript_72897:2235-2837(+)
MPSCWTGKYTKKCRRRPPSAGSLRANSRREGPWGGMSMSFKLTSAPPDNSASFEPMSKIDSEWKNVSKLTSTSRFAKPVFRAVSTRCINSDVLMEVMPSSCGEASKFVTGSPRTNSSSGIKIFSRINLWFSSGTAPRSFAARASRCALSAAPRISAQAESSKDSLRCRLPSALRRQQRHARLRCWAGASATALAAWGCVS